MSGGSFDYAYSRVNYFADELDDKISRCNEVNDWGEKPYEFSPEVMIKLQEISDIAKRTAHLMRAVEWLYSGDDSEETFLNKIDEALK